MQILLWTTLPENRAAQTCDGHCGPIVKEWCDLTFAWGEYSGFYTLSSRGHPSFSVVVWHALHLQRTTSEHFVLDRSRTSFEVLSGTSGRAERVLRWCVSLPPACVHDYGRSSASAAFHYDARCWCIRMSQCVHPYAANNVRAWVSAPHAQMDTVSPASTDSLTGGIGLAANGAGPRRCTAGMTPASVRTRDRRTEARTGPGPLCSRNGRPHPGFPGVT